MGAGTNEGEINEDCRNIWDSKYRYIWKMLMALWLLQNPWIGKLLMRTWSNLVEMTDDRSNHQRNHVKKRTKIMTIYWWKTNTRKKYKKMKIVIYHSQLSADPALRVRLLWAIVPLSLTLDSDFIFHCMPSQLFSNWEKADEPGLYVPCHDIISKGYGQMA